MSDRFASFTGWELQAIARGVDGITSDRPEQVMARDRLMDEIHAEFDEREKLGFQDPQQARDEGER